MRVNEEPFPFFSGKAHEHRGQGDAENERRVWTVLEGAGVKEGLSLGPDATNFR